MRKKKKATMLCPFCLGGVVFEQRSEKRRNGYVRTYFACSQCEESVPRMYVDDYHRYPPVVVSSVGFTQHGKTVYFSSLFYLLRHLDLATRWPGFSTLCLNDDSLETVWQCVRGLREGHLPDATPKMFPSPTILRLEGFRGQRDCTLIMYDTAGESFRRPQQLVQYARFVERANTVLFFVSLPRLSKERDAVEDALYELLETYIVGVRELGAREKWQRLVVVFTMGDVIGEALGKDWSWFREALIAPRPGDEVQSKHISTSGEISSRLCQFTCRALSAHNFHNLASGFFRETTYCLVSALGAPPTGDNSMATCVVPRRVLDPLVHVIRDRRTPGKRSLFSSFLG